VIVTRPLCPECGRPLASYLGAVHCRFCEPKGPPPAGGPDWPAPDEGPGLVLTRRAARLRRLWARLRRRHREAVEPVALGPLFPSRSPEPVSPFPQEEVHVR
jgi:hypothetical protein